MSRHRLLRLRRKILPSSILRVKQPGISKEFASKEFAGFSNYAGTDRERMRDDGGLTTSARWPGCNARPRQCFQFDPAVPNLPKKVMRDAPSCSSVGRAERIVERDGIGLCTVARTRNCDVFSEAVAGLFRVNRTG